MARTGKIARLPHAIREDLNLRLQNGEQGTKLVEWLNALPPVQEVLDDKFGGRPINEQNLTEWRQGGFEEWRHLQETRDWLEHMREEAADLDPVIDVASPADWLSASLAVSLGRCFRTAMADGIDNPYKRRMVLNVAHEIGQLRRRDHEAARFRFDQERWKAKQSQEHPAPETRPSSPKWHSREPVESEPVETAACDSSNASPEPAPTVPSADEPTQASPAAKPTTAPAHEPAAPPQILNPKSSFLNTKPSLPNPPLPRVNQTKLS